LLFDQYAPFAILKPKNRKTGPYGQEQNNSPRLLGRAIKNRDLTEAKRLVEEVGVDPKEDESEDSVEGAPRGLESDRGSAYGILAACKLGDTDRIKPIASGDALGQIADINQGHLMDRDYSLIPFISKEARESVEAGMRMAHFWNSSEADNFHGAHMYNKHYGVVVDRVRPAQSGPRGRSLCGSSAVRKQQPKRAASSEKKNSRRVTRWRG
jgi:hypothetical protein